MDVKLQHMVFWPQDVIYMARFEVFSYLFYIRFQQICILKFSVLFFFSLEAFSYLLRVLVSSFALWDRFPMLGIFFSPFFFPGTYFYAFWSTLLFIGTHHLYIAVLFLGKQSYTGTANFILRCGVCQIGMVGQKVISYLC